MTLQVLIVAILLGGWLFSRIARVLSLPPVLGMTVWGILLAAAYQIWWPELRASGGLPEAIDSVAPFLKSLALVIILLRAGLGISRRQLHRIGKTALFMSFVPALFEVAVVTPLAHVLLGLGLIESLLLGFLVAAVSPAVVVPAMLDFKENGIGQTREVPTLVLAGASLDDVFAITMFSVLLVPAASGGGAASASTYTLLGYALQLPYALVIGIVPGLLLGLFFSWYLGRFHQSIRPTEKALLVLGCAMALLSVGDVLQSAALLGVMTMGFVLLEQRPLIAHELSGKLSRAWVFAEIVLFVLIGLNLDFAVAAEAGLPGLAVLMAGLAGRSAGVLLATVGSGLNARECLFCVIAYTPKATVQAALGAVPLAAGVAGGATMLSVAVLAILVTAPIGLIGIRSFGPRLLQSTHGSSTRQQPPDS